MHRCGDQYGVFVAGKWKWGLTYEEADRIESEALRAQVQRKLAQGGTVILTTDMTAKVDALAKD